jgi:DNA processing protein
VAADLGTALADLGVVVVSGLAAGIDAEVQRAALARGGHVVGVVAGGLDHPYPRRNRDLWAAIAERGWLVAEAPLGVRPDAWRFPLRNRIIAGLADVVVVVESASKGGSLHTVREAEQRDRAVLAVPGPVTSAASAGTNDLLADGCAPCRSVDDIATALDLVHATDGWRQKPSRKPSADGVAMGRAATAVLDALGWDCCTLDAVVASTGMALVQVLAAVEELAGAGLVTNDGGLLERRVVGR